MRIEPEIEKTRMPSVRPIATSPWVILAIWLALGASSLPTLAAEPPGVDPEESEGTVESEDAGDRGSGTVGDSFAEPATATPGGETAPGSTGRGEESAASDTAGGRPDLDRAGEIDRVVGDCWWNRPQVVAALELETGQRERMDAVMKEYLEVLYEPRDESLRRNPFRVALKRGDLDEASRVLDERARKMAEETVREGRMMVEVLGHLGAEQRETLATKFPQVFRARWLMTFGGGGRGGGRGAAGLRARRRSVDGPGGME